MCDAPSYYMEAVRVARTEHTCCECRKPITPRTPYQHVRGIWDGEWGVFKTCASCVWLREMLTREGVGTWGHDYCFGFGELKTEWWETYGAPLPAFPEGTRPDQ